MTSPFTRRRFLTVSAAALSVAASGSSATPPVTRWRGTALGAAASLQLAGVAPDRAAGIVLDVQTELRRLETIFSLYRPSSELRRLNAAGRLDAPSPELLSVLSTCAVLHAQTGGAFDPTVQPLFAAAARAASEGRTPSRHELAEAKARIGWQRVRFDAASVTLSGDGTALTLNGIAQGFVTDRIAWLLKAHGLRDVLVDMGEIAAAGRRPDGAPWHAGVADSGGAIVKRLRLSDRALATSAPKGTVLDARGLVGHIFDPARGAEADARATVSVSAARADLADGLSTALCVVPANRHAAVIRRFPGARIEFAD